MDTNKAAADQVKVEALALLLTQQQRDHLAAILQQVILVGFGDVMIRIEKAKPRFISMRIEQILEPGKDDHTLKLL